MVDDSVTGVVKLEEVLQCSCPLVVDDFDVVYRDWWDGNCCFTAWGKEPWQAKW